MAGKLGSWYCFGLVGVLLSWQSLVLEGDKDLLSCHPSEGDGEKGSDKGREGSAFRQPGDSGRAWDVMIEGCIAGKIWG